MNTWQSINPSKMHGFTLVELLAALAIVGVVATLALPRYRAQIARARQAEAVTNLNTIRDLQKTYYYEGDRRHYHSGLHYGINKCGNSGAEGGNELGFKMPDCSKSRYRYITNAGNDCAKSDGSLDQGKVYPGCTANDEWQMSSTGELTNTHDVIKSCPGGGSAPSSGCNAVALPTTPAPPSPPTPPGSPSPHSPPPPASPTPVVPPPAPAPTCPHNVCWVNASSQCVKCGIVGGIKTTVPCSSCNIPTPYVPPLHGSPPSSPPSPPSSPPSPPSSPPSPGGHRVCHYQKCCENWISTPVSSSTCRWSRSCSLTIAERDSMTRMTPSGLVFDDIVNNGVLVRCECLIQFVNSCSSIPSDSTSITPGYEGIMQAVYN